ncbi:MAG: type II secretion system protein GspM [Rhizobiaceae bacterium]
MDRLTALLNAPLALRRSLALALLVVYAAIVVAVVWITIDSFGDNAANLHSKRLHLGNLQSIIALREALTERNKSALEEASGPEFLKGTSEAVIRGNLQSRLSEIAAAHKVKILSVGNTPVRQRGSVRYAGLRADFAGTNEAIHATLFDIETSKPYLVIRNATIRSTLSSQSAGKNAPPELVVQIQFYGALPPESAEAGG